MFDSDDMDDRIVGGLLACVIAADLAHPDGVDKAFAEWLATPTSGREFWGWPWQEPTPYQPASKGAAVAQEIATDLLSCRRRGLTESSLEDEDEDSDDNESTLPNYFYILFGELPLVAKRPPFPLPALHLLRGLDTEAVVTLAARAGASMFPPDWWLNGSLGDPQMRGALIRRASAVPKRHTEGIDEAQASEFLRRAAETRSAADPVEHPSGGLWFGNPLSAFDVPAEVTAIVALGEFPSGVGARHIEVEISLPWMWGQDPTAGDTVDLWLDCLYPGSQDYIKHTVYSPPSPASWDRRQVLLDSATAMIQQLRALDLSVLVLGDWSGQWLSALWTRLGDPAYATTEDEDAVGPGKGPLGAYNWKPRTGWLAPATAVAPPGPVATWTVRSDWGAAFYGVSVGDKVTYGDQIEALRRQHWISTDVWESVWRAIHESPWDAQNQGDDSAAAWFQDVMDIEQLEAKQVLDFLERQRRWWKL